jgi:lipopolysaccharide/colanic/teichoic acid biosynthesis glycosyltransferase
MLIKDFVQEGIAAALLPRDFSGLPLTGAGVLQLPANSNAPFSEPTSSVVFLARASGPAPSRHRWYLQHGKRALDIALVLISLPVTLPLILLSALALWIEGGSPFYRQNRLGASGVPFSIWKLRTMGRNAEAELQDHLDRDPALRLEWEATQKLKQDPRVTRIGRILRMTSLDELPQLVNVVRGEMSLVGPRPMLPEQLPLYGDPSPYFALKPGITGIWQVSARNEQVFSYRARTDALYFSTASFWGDVKLMFRTLGVVVRSTGY